MQLNYHFLKFLVPELNVRMKGLCVQECFSQNKDELIIGFYSPTHQIYIQSNLHPSISCISFPSEFKRKKKNTVSLFSEMIGETVLQVKIVHQERAFYIEMISGAVLLFKLHGNRSNILFYKNDFLRPIVIFRHDLSEDLLLSMEGLDKNYPLDLDRFRALEGNASLFLPTLGKIPREWLKQSGYIQASLEKKWELMQELLDLLEAPLFSIVKKENEYEISLLPEENYLSQTEDPIKASNELFKYKVVVQAFEKEKNERLKGFEDQKKRTIAYLKKTEEKLAELQNGSSPSQLADVIMANLHQFEGKTGEVVLFNFYTGKEEIVQVKRGMSPQKFAENLYRKSKNRKIELEQLTLNLKNKQNQLASINLLIEEIKSIEDHRGLREFVKVHQLERSKNEVQDPIPFKRFEEFGFEIWVGKSAKGNDEMLRSYAYKEDLWLHAKDLSGSHVIVKYQSGKTFPKPVLERAAELALYYSKAKNETFAPVTYTAVKYVRKVKGSPAGAVMVDKESVLMSSPKGPEEVN
jgi:predicted ribosome quality control (RQC) complex YloA/Tae2 family protein